jgi:hypothetical protein
MGVFIRIVVVFSLALGCSDFSKAAESQLLSKEETKKLSNKIIKGIQLYGDAVKQNNKYMNIFAEITQIKDKKIRKEKMKRLAIQGKTADLSVAKLIGSDLLLAVSYKELGDSYYSYDEKNKACLNWQKARDYFVRLSNALWIEHLNKKLKSHCSN